MAPPARRLMVQTTEARSAVSANVAPRSPTRSNSRPIGRQMAAPTSVAQRLIFAYVTRSRFRSRSIGSVMSPRPCVRPGRVASMMTAATTTLIQPVHARRTSLSAADGLAASILDAAPGLIMGRTGGASALPCELSGRLVRHANRPERTGILIAQLGIVAIVQSRFRDVGHPADKRHGRRTCQAVLEDS